jgi:hypothetical protein
MTCHRCKARPGKAQPTDGDAAMLFAAGAHVSNEGVELCHSCQRTLEAMALRVAGPTRAGSRVDRTGVIDAEYEEREARKPAGTSDFDLSGMHLPEKESP